MSGDSALFDRPVLVLDPGVHTGSINRADADAAGRIAVTGSHDRTVRVWSVEEGRLLHTIRLPQGPDNVGKVYAVAISPDGAVIAAGGWTHWTTADPQEQIYLFDASSETMLHRIEGLPNVVHHLAFAPDGRRLAAALGGGHGLRLYNRERGWAEAARDPDYGDASFGAAFARDGRLATTCYDGRLRLYSADGSLLRMAKSGGMRPALLAFDPDGARLAVGFADSPVVRLFDGSGLDPLPAPYTTGIDNGNLVGIAWSADGATLFAAGTFADGSIHKVAAWDGAGNGPLRVLPAGRNTVMSLRPLPGGDLLVAATDPWLGRLGRDGAPRWSHGPQKMDARGQCRDLGLAADGMVVDFGIEQWGGARARFDLATLTLGVDPPDDDRTAPPAQQGLAITNWEDSTSPRLDGEPLPVAQYERSRCLAIHPDGARFLLGAEWNLRAFDAAGTELWRRKVPGIARAVNISGDGRLALAAYGDGTLRWHRMEDGAELLAFFPMIDRKNWVAWTPEGVYAATPGARGLLRWHVTHGWDAPGEAIPVSDIPETYRPEVIRHVLPQLGTPGALAVTELAVIRGAVQRATGSAVAPGARLHVLTIGVSKHGPAARHLDLPFAGHDARDLANALNAQRGFYADVIPITLLDFEATKAGIIWGLEQVRDGMAAGAGADLAVILFAGHGNVVDDEFFLYPHEVDVRLNATIKASALSIGQFHSGIADIAKHGRVVVFIDACRAGAATALGSRTLRAMLTGANVTVFTASTAEEKSVEHPDWQNGAFTEALLEALRRADYDHDTLIGVSDLSRYLRERVPALTGGKQRPDVEIRFDTQIFAATPL